MPTTSNFGWNTPADTDLVKDGAAAIRTLGNNIDASLVDLKGGTTGQVLAKATNTDLDFTWVAQDDSNAIQNAIVDAKGDLITATAADTPARLAVGTNGQYLQADSTTATGLKWATISAGGMTEIASGTLSGTAVNLTSIPGTYKDLRLVVRNYLPTVDGQQLNIRFNNDSTSSRYRRDNFSNANITSTFNENSLNGSGSQDSGTSQGIIVIDIPDYANTTTWKFISGFTFSNNDATTTSAQVLLLYGIYNQTGAITQVNLIQSQGMSGGTYILYGVS